MTAPTRPVLRWHGGKWRLAPWIIAHFPRHRVYVEPYGGAGSVLMRKPRAYAEVWNDLDREVVTLFRVLRSPRAGELIEALRLTPFARAEFKAAYEPAEDEVETARRLVIRLSMGFNPARNGQRTGFRAAVSRKGGTACADWTDYPDSLAAVVERLRGCIIESRPALEVMRQYDGPGTLHYIDPPYLPETRAQAGLYAHEMTPADHAEMLEAIAALQGMVVLSGYPSALYDDALRHWRRVEKDTFADGARARTEVLWINPAAVARLDDATTPLFAEAS